MWLLYDVNAGTDVQLTNGECNVNDAGQGRELSFDVSLTASDVIRTVFDPESKAVDGLITFSVWQVT